MLNCLCESAHRDGEHEIHKVVWRTAILHTSKRVKKRTNTTTSSATSPTRTLATTNYYTNSFWQM
jgi:hypothetical protein